MVSWSESEEKKVKDKVVETENKLGDIPTER